MRTAEARESFERYLAGHRVPLASVDALVAMVDWAGAEPADDVMADDDGDMLLYQWGTYDWTYSGAYAFELNVTASSSSRTRTATTGSGSSA